MAPLLLTIPQTCKALSLGRTTTYSLIAAGKLEVVRIGRRTLVKFSSVEALAESGAAITRPEGGGDL